MTRLTVASQQPDVYAAFVGVEEQLKKSMLPFGVRELVKIRVSQLNGCA